MRTRTAPRTPAPLARVVAATTLTGALCTLVVVLMSGPSSGPWLRSPVLALPWAHGPVLAALLAALTCASELVAVRLHRQEAVEELTLLDPMVLLDVLLLPPRQALLVALLGIALAYALRRRAPIKAAFNIGTYAAGTALLVLLLHACVAGSTGSAGFDLRLAADSTGFDLRLAAGLLLGAAGFVAVNVLSMSWLLTALGTGRFGVLVRQDLRLTAFTLAATVALAGTVATLAVHSPLFLPFAALPAAAITYAYRATATELEERLRSSRVLAFSQVLAAGPDQDAATQAFLEVARDAFRADEVLVILDTGAGHPARVLSLADAGPIPATAAHQALLARSASGADLFDHGFGLPDGWAGGLVAPLEADGTRIGAAAVGWRARARRRPTDLTLLTPLASALAVALSNARHLARLLAETSKLRAVVDQSSDGILVLDGQGRVQLWNPALARLCGVSEQAALGRPVAEVLPARDEAGAPVDAFAVAAPQLQPDRPHTSSDLLLVRPDGEHRSVRCAHAGSFEAGRLVRDVVNVHDLTRERQVDRLKSDFVASVSHELRTPITPIKGYAELLRRRGDEMTAQKRAQMLDVIADRAAHLGRLVEDLLLASRVDDSDAPVCTIQAVTADLAGLAVRAVEDFSAAGGRVQLHVPDEPVPVRCDSTRAIQVLTNLVSNALKYSPDGSPIEITVDADGDAGRVSVRDHGRGLPEDQLERIFEKFHRVEDPLVMSTSGTGLGLYIARRLAQAMDGELDVRSVLGQGSTFTLRLPLAPAVSGTPAVPEPRGPRPLSSPPSLPLSPSPSPPSPSPSPSPPSPPSPPPRTA